MNQKLSMGHDVAGAGVDLATRDEARAKHSWCWKTEERRTVQLNHSVYSLCCLKHLECMKPTPAPIGALTNQVDTGC